MHSMEDPNARLYTDACMKTLEISKPEWDACLMLEENISTASGMEIMKRQSLDNRKQGDHRFFFNLICWNRKGIGNRWSYKEAQ